MAATEVYKSNITAYEQQVSAIKEKRTVIGVLRLLIVVVAAITIKVTWQADLWIILTESAVAIALFLYAVSRDTDLKEKLLNAERLLKINHDELELLNGNFLQRETGQEFAVSNHDYSNDLDIFGTASLYQYINRCTSLQGKQLLANALLQPTTKEQILLKQAAVKELSGNTAWRQQMQAYGIASPLTTGTENKIKQWLTLPDVFVQPGWRVLANIFPVVSLGCVVLYAVNVLPAPVFYLLVFLFLVFGFSLSKKIHTTWVLLSKIVGEADTLYHQLAFIEEQAFSSTYISTIHNSLQNTQGAKASREIRELKNILNRFDVRLNIFAFYFLNTFLLWDLRQQLSLNQWKAKNAKVIAQWFTAIAEMEVLSSIGTLAFNREKWCYPVISDDHFTFSATALGHPLIADSKRVDSNFGLQGIGKVSIITGSNMGGKSTFLRSIGVNIVLAMMGAPVCAEGFTISVVKLMSSMRIADNLAESTSTFYAELKKLKAIIEAVNNHEKIFILLDEILRGTNSLDRHTGSGALIKQLIQQQAVAVIATHDVELAKLEDSYTNAISNYHFDVQVENDELYFDYKLKPGICTSLNASILMRKIGIELTPSPPSPLHSV